MTEYQHTRITPETYPIIHLCICKDSHDIMCDSDIHDCICGSKKFRNRKCHSTEHVCVCYISYDMCQSNVHECSCNIDVRTCQAVDDHVCWCSVIISI
jgi:hypothetical protein